MTLDGYCDHTAIDADAEIHQHYTELLLNGGSILYGRITFQLMKYWQTVVKHPTGDKSMDEFAVVMDQIPKIVFSHTLQDEGQALIDWQSARLANRTLQQEVSELRQLSTKDVLVGSRSLIIQLLKLNLIDEFQLCIHPVVAGRGLTLFASMNDRMHFKLLKTKRFNGGAVIHYYAPANGHKDGLS